MLSTDQVKELQDALKMKGADIAVDGQFGPKTQAAVYGILVGSTAQSVFISHPGFDVAARARLSHAHPKLQEVMNEARAQMRFTILESQRGRAAQEDAVRTGHSKVHFGESAHNWDPSIALDVAPLPIAWDNRAPFIDLSKIILSSAKRLKVPLRWGGDWGMNGIMTDESFSDLPHYELHPWREWAKGSKPYGE